MSLGQKNSTQFVYPYDVEILPAKNNRDAAKVYISVYISLWGDGTITVVNPANSPQILKHIKVERHPTF